MESILNSNDVNSDSTDFDDNIADFFLMLSDSQRESLVTDVDNTSSRLSDGNNNVALRQDSGHVTGSTMSGPHLNCSMPNTCHQTYAYPPVPLISNNNGTININISHN